MVSTASFFIIISLILQCWLVNSSAPMLRVFRRRHSYIRLSELTAELRHEPLDVLRSHLTLMVMVSSYGDSLYNLDTTLDEKCFKIIGAVTLMVQKLAICKEANKYIDDTIEAVARDLKNPRYLEEHPLELFCGRIEKDFAERWNISSTFGKKKKETPSFKSANLRSPYSPVILRSEDSMMSTLIDWLDVPELAKLIAHASFQEVIDGYAELPLRMHFFADSCQAVAQIERFAVSMQTNYEKTINFIVPEISAHNRHKKFEYSFDNHMMWWVPKMMRVFYHYIAEDPILKKKVDSMAPILRPTAEKEDLDFSRL